MSFGVSLVKLARTLVFQNAAPLEVLTGATMTSIPTAGGMAEVEDLED